MGEAKRRSLPVGRCIYCGATGTLTDEHVIPYGLGGDLILKDASCAACAKETSKLERRLLRGHWWPYRQFLGLPSRRPSGDVPDLPIKIKRADGTELAATIPMAKQSLAMVFELDPPSVLNGIMRTDKPNAPRVYIKKLAELPSIVNVDGHDYEVGQGEEFDIPVHFDAADLCRFLAKVSHGVAINRRGLNCCSEFFLPPLILGETLGAQSFVGGCSSPLVGKRLPGNGLHAFLDRLNGDFLTVYIQLFRDQGDPPPIYEIVVGRV